MPITRSRSGTTPLPETAPQPTVTETAPQPTATTPASQPTATATTATRNTAATETETNTWDQTVFSSTTEAPQTEQATEGHPTVQKSKSVKSRRSQRLQKAKEELLRLQMEYAAARVNALEDEANSDSEPDSDEGTVTARQETTHRVTNWLNHSTSQIAIAEKPHEATLQQQSFVEQQSTHQAPLLIPAGEETMAIAKPTQQQINISELASAIALAARSGQQMAPRSIQELPSYSGTYQEWLSFKAAYTETASMHSEYENLARLRRSLRGTAKEAVESLLMYNAKTEEIMKTLESRFGRPDAIALAELERLRSLQRPTDSPKELCIFATRVGNIIATLQALQRVYYLYNPEVTKQTIEKLTPALRYRWFDFAAENQTEEADLLKLARFLRREADRCGPYAQPEDFKRTVYETQAQRRPAQRTYATDGDETQAQRRPAQRTYATEEQKPERRCPVCEKTEHSITKCDKFKEADSDARWQLAKTKALCYRCLRPRATKHTCKRKQCNVDGCDRLHHYLLHFNRKKENEEKTEVVTSTWAPTKSQAYLKIVPVCISGPKGDVNTYALLDDGSTVTLIDSEIARQAGAEGPVDPLHIEAIGDTEVEAHESKRVTVTLRGSTHSYSIQARTLNNLKLSAQQITDEDMRGCQHLLDIQKRLTYRNAVPKLLIGQDNWHLLLAKEVRRGKRRQPVASRTPLGWVLHGAHTRTLGQHVNYVNHVTDADADMNEQLRQYFAIDSLTIAPKQPRNSEEQRALDTLQKNTLQREDGHYETALLWKQTDSSMPLNYENAHSRLLNIEKKIDRNPQLKEKYTEQMNALVKKGYAEPAPAQPTRNRTWYLPHFAVLHPMKPDKVRVVHDAAAKTRGVCLNDYLLTGPDLLQSLPGVLMRFRQHRIAVTADIAEMFMQVKIREQDRDALRYLWRGEERGGTQPQQYRMTSLIFGATSSPATAIYVKNRNADKYQDTHPAAHRAIIKNHYVDDYLQSFDTEKEAIQIASDVKKIQKEAHYELRKWKSNSRRVLQALDTSDTTEPQRTVRLHDGGYTSLVLGTLWNPNTDSLSFNLDSTRLPKEEATPTKREMLKIIMSLFDPLGLASPITIRAKQILQETWRRGTGWDDVIDTDLAQQWEEWLQHLKSLKKIAIPRHHIGYSRATRRELHVFVDASETAYAAALYWRMVDAEGKATLSLIVGKARVAPLKLTSIPRLELQAAAMGSRMATAVIEEHDEKPDAKFFWTDSRTVLTWVKNGARNYRPYVAHRIAEIEENSATNEWRWIPTKQNVADDATRNMPSNIDITHRWFRGPEFLFGDPSTWPTADFALTKETGEERTHTVIERESTPALRNALPNSERFSKWEKLVRATARVLQFVELCKTRKKKSKDAVNYRRNKKNKEKDPAWQQRKPDARVAPKKKETAIATPYIPIGAELLRRAETLIVRASQEEAFKREIEDASRGKPPHSNSRLRTLAFEIINGVVVLKTRIDAASDIEDSIKRPPIVDGNHRAARLYIDYVHRQLHHSGVEATINECRQHLWILRLRPTARKVIHSCIPCRIRRNTPPAPSTGNHPYTRLAHHQRPFTYCGLDYFGPLTVTVGRATQKRYVALFTCLTTRAVHLEIAASLTTDSAVMALRRMIARRGCPAEVWSDNGTNLQGAAKELRQQIDAATQEEASKKTIEWRFIPPSAPFMGGAWERLVRSVKEALATTLHQRHPQEEVLHTLLAEVEYTVNSRPLTHVPVSPDDEEALTPNHFLLGGSARVPPLGKFSETDLLGRTHWRASQQLANAFWNRWIREYLPELQNRREPRGRGPNVKTGDVVLIADGTLPRNLWPRGLITHTYPGPDGVTRVVDVRTKGGTLRRPVKKLIVLPTGQPTTEPGYQDGVKKLIVLPTGQPTTEPGYQDGGLREETGCDARQADDARRERCTEQTPP